MMKTYYEGEQWQVTDSLVRTPKKSFSLGKLDAVSLKRTFFLFAAGPSIGFILITLFFWRYLYISEIVFILLCAVAALIISFQIGTLKVDALSLKDDEGGTVHGNFARLSKIRDAIELAMQEAHAKSNSDPL